MGFVSSLSFRVAIVDLRFPNSIRLVLGLLMIVVYVALLLPLSLCAILCFLLALLCDLFCDRCIMLHLLFFPLLFFIFKILYQLRSRTHMSVQGATACTV